MEKILSDRLKQLLATRDISLAEFAEMCNLPLETVRNIYYARTQDPKVSTIMAMADALNLGVNCLMGKCSHTKEERHIIELYRQCGSHGKSVIELIAKYEAISAKAERDTLGKHKIPCILPKGSIRGGIVYDECETIEIDTSVEEAYVGIQMPTNDLAPVYCKGDILLYENRFPAHEEYGAFFKGKRVYIRQYLEEDKQYRLRSIHDENRDLIFTRMDQIDYIGTCIGVLRE